MAEKPEKNWHSLVKRGIAALTSSAFIYGLYSSSPDLIEEYYSNGIFKYVARAEGFLGDNLPFSTFEGLLMASGAGISFYTSRGIFKLLKKTDPKKSKSKQKKTSKLKSWRYKLFEGTFKYCTLIASEVLVLSFLGLANLNRVGFTEKSGLVKKEHEMNLEDLVNRINHKKEKIGEWKFDKKSLNEKLNLSLRDAYLSANKQDISGASKVKDPLFLPMREIGLGGLTFFSIDSLVDTEYEDINSVWAMAHEKAHAKGYMRETDAESLAYLACIKSNDDVLEYCAYIHLLNLSLADLKQKDASKAKRIYAKLNKDSRDELFDICAGGRIKKEQLSSKIIRKYLDFILKIKGQGGFTASYFSGPLRDMWLIDNAFSGRQLK